MAAAMNVWTDVDVGSPTFVTRLTEAMDDLLEQLGWFDGANVYWLHAGQIWALGDVICAGAEFEERDLGLTPTCNYEPTFSGVWGCEFDLPSFLYVPFSTNGASWFDEGPAFWFLDFGGTLLLSGSPYETVLGLDFGGLDPEINVVDYTEDLGFGGYVRQWQWGFSPAALLYNNSVAPALPQAPLYVPCPGAATCTALWQRWYSAKIAGFVRNVVVGGQIDRDNGAVGTILLTVTGIAGDFQCDESDLDCLLTLPFVNGNGLNGYTVWNIAQQDGDEYFPLTAGYDLPCGDGVKWGEPSGYWGMRVRVIPFQAVNLLDGTSPGYLDTGFGIPKDGMGDEVRILDPIRMDADCSTSTHVELESPDGQLCEKQLKNNTPEIEKSFRLGACALIGGTITPEGPTNLVELQRSFSYDSQNHVLVDRGEQFTTFPNVHEGHDSGALHRYKFGGQNQSGGAYRFQDTQDPDVLIEPLVRFGLMDWS